MDLELPINYSIKNNNQKIKYHKKYIQLSKLLTQYNFMDLNYKEKNIGI